MSLSAVMCRLSHFFFSLILIVHSINVLLLQVSLACMQCSILIRIHRAILECYILYECVAYPISGCMCGLPQACMLGKLQCGFCRATGGAAAWRPPSTVFVLARRLATLGRRGCSCRCSTSCGGAGCFEKPYCKL